MSQRPHTEGASILFRADLLDYLRDLAHERNCSLSRVVNEAVLLAKHTAEELEALDDTDTKGA